MNYLAQVGSWNNNARWFWNLKSERLSIAQYDANPYSCLSSPTTFTVDINNNGKSSSTSIYTSELPPRRRSSDCRTTSQRERPHIGNSPTMSKSNFKKIGGATVLAALRRQTLLLGHRNRAVCNLMWKDGRWGENRPENNKQGTTEPTVPKTKQPKQLPSHGRSVSTPRRRDIRIWILSKVCKPWILTTSHATLRFGSTLTQRRPEKDKNRIEGRVTRVPEWGELRTPSKKTISPHSCCPTPHCTRLASFSLFPFPCSSGRDRSHDRLH